MTPLRTTFCDHVTMSTDIKHEGLMGFQDMRVTRVTGGYVLFDAHIIILHERTIVVLNQTQET